LVSLNPFNRKDTDGLGPNNMPYPPNEVLQHIDGAPKGDDFDDAYYSWADDLPRELKLPDSDLLKALHTYASDYYGHAESATHSLLSMDGTALIASAILLEELVAESLEKSGNLVFCEAKGEDNGELPKFWNGMRWVDRHLPADTPHGRRRETREASQSVVPDTVGKTEAQGIINELQQRRHLVQYLVADLQRSNAGRLSNEMQAILAEGRSNILSVQDRQMVESRIRDIETQMEAKRLQFLRGR
jgi:hypothetical protein